MPHRNPTEYIVLLYIIFWPIRIRGCFRRWRQPLLRGPEWFFNLPVQSGFYSGPGKKLLRQYRWRIMIPFAFDIPIAAAIFLSGHLLYLNWLVIVLCALIHLNHVYSVDYAERHAAPWAVPQAEEPTAVTASSLSPRRLRDYSSARTEWALALPTVIGFLWLLRYYFTAPQHHDLRLVFGVPLFYLYAQLGLLLVKRYIIAWRSPIPQIDAAQHIAVREQTRAYYLKVCDFHRTVVSASIFLWPLLLTASPAGANHLFALWFWGFLALSLIATVWVEIKRKQLADMSVKARPVKLPDLLHQSELARWPVCYQPSAPLLILKGARGYSLNLANTLTYLSAAYLAGMFVLIAVLRTSH